MTTKTCQGWNLLQSERNAVLMIDVLRSHVAAGKFWLHDFVVMPNHMHLLITVGGGMSIEKARQLINGRSEIAQKGVGFSPCLRPCEIRETIREFLR